MKARIITIAVVLIFLLPVAGWGQEKKNYVVLKTGLYTFKSDLREADIATGFDGEAAYGRYLHPNFVLEGGTGYFHDGVNKVFGNEVKGIPVILTAKGVYPLKGWELFAGGGVGVYFTEFHGSVRGKFSESRDTLFGGHILGGAGVDISNMLFLGLEGKYLFTNKGDFEVLETNLNGYTVTVSLGFRF
jgi:opacity protein-like surface antigen